VAHGDGRVFQQRRKDGTLKSSKFWISYYINGREIRESAGATEKEAQRLLRRRLAARDSGQSIETEDVRLTVSAMLDTYEAHLRQQGKKSPDTTRSHLKPVRAAFGDRKALSLRPKDFEDYREDRRTEGKAPATIDNELGALRAAYRLAKKQERISRVPHVPLYHADNARQGFTDREQFEAVAANLPGALADVVRFAYLSAWRRGEVVPLRWTQVDRKAREVRLETSKNGRKRTLPLEGELSEIIERRWQARQFETPNGTALSPLVFHDGGRPIVDFRKAWKSACVKAGLGRFVPQARRPGLRYEGLLFHDLRRSGIRNLIRAGVPQSVAMSISGHRTVSTFIRYAIASDEDKREALRAVQERAGHSVPSVVPLKGREITENQLSR
jgi:integrase